MTVAEVMHGAFRKKRMNQPFQFLIDSLDIYEVLESNPSVCRFWGRIVAERYRQPISLQDAWIAATALAYDIPLVTHDARDFEGIDGLVLKTEYRNEL